MRVSFEPRLPLQICLDHTHTMFFLMCRHRSLTKLGTRECHLNSFVCVCWGPEGTHSHVCPCPPPGLSHPAPCQLLGPSVSASMVHQQGWSPPLTALPCTALGPAETSPMQAHVPAQPQLREILISVFDREVLIQWSCLSISQKIRRRLRSF